MDKELLYKRLGQNIRHLRKQVGLTQIQLAERIDRSEDAVSNIERGTSAPPPETALAIAQALELQLTDLYDLDVSGTPIPQDIKDYLRSFRADLANMDEVDRTAIYDVLDKIVALAIKK
jgi:transcriptional regulator with XRE-family HTH domain